MTIIKRKVFEVFKYLDRMLKLNPDISVKINGKKYNPK